MSVLKQMDHTAYPKSLKSKDSAALRFIINDCRQAIAAMPDNPNCGYYQDEIHYCAMELAKRDPINPDNLVAPRSFQIATWSEYCAWCQNHLGRYARIDTYNQMVKTNRVALEAIKLEVEAEGYVCK